MIDYQVILKNFLDDQGRLKIWPAKWKYKVAAAAYLAERIPLDVHFTEREINELLDRYHIFGDPAVLRRALFDLGHLDRTSDGALYWRVVEGDQASDI